MVQDMHDDYSCALSPSQGSSTTCRAGHRAETRQTQHYTEFWKKLIVSLWNSSGIFSRIQLCDKFQKFLSKMSEKSEEFTGRMIFMSMFNDISWGSKKKKQECELSVQLDSIYANIFSPGRWSFFGLGPKKKCCSTHESKRQRECDIVAEFMMVKFSES